MRHSMLIACWVVVNASAVLAAPRLTCDAVRFNFGQVTPSGHIEHTFILFNGGDADLVIDKVGVSCGCTTTELKSKTIQPGQSVELPVKLSLERERGAVRKSVTIESNDPKQPKYVLWLEGMVYSPVTVTPSQVFFGSLSPDRRVTRTVDVAIDEQANVRVRGALAVPKAGSDKDLLDGLVVKVEPVTIGTLYRVEISFDPRGSLGKLSATVRLQTDSDQVPNIDIPISAVIAGALNFTPQAVLLSPEHKTPVTRYILVTRNRAPEVSPVPATSGDAFEIKKVHVPSDEIAVEVKPVGMHGYRIRLSNLVASAELAGQSIVIETDVAAMPKLVIPIQIADDGPVGDKPTADASQASPLATRSEAK